jgi:hypothetical protein
MIFLILGAGVMGISGCANLNQPTQSEAKAFFLAGQEANFLGIKSFSSKSVDLSPYAQQMGVKYPRTFQIDVLSGPPSRPYKSFAVLECEPAANSNPEELVEKLKCQAREIGADAIILSSGMARTAKMQAVAIKYRLMDPSDKGNNS